MTAINQPTDQCSLCEPGACHDDACPHEVVKQTNLQARILADVINAAWTNMILNGDGTGPGDPLGLLSASPPKSAVGMTIAHFPPSYQFTTPPGHRVVTGTPAASGEISNDDVRHVPFGEWRR